MLFTVKTRPVKVISVTIAYAFQSTSLEEGPRQPSFSTLSHMPLSAILTSGPAYPVSTRLGCPENAFCIDTGMYLVFHDDLSVKDMSFPVPVLIPKHLRQLRILLQTLFPPLLPAYQNGNISPISKCVFQCLSLSSLYKYKFWLRTPTSNQHRRRHCCWLRSQ